MTSQFTIGGLDVRGGSLSPFAPRKVVFRIENLSRSERLQWARVTHKAGNLSCAPSSASAGAVGLASINRASTNPTYLMSAPHREGSAVRATPPP